MIKSFREFNEDLEIVPIPGTKSKHLVYDEPSNDKSLSSGVMLNQRLKNQEFIDKISKRSIEDLQKTDPGMAVTLNNLNFLKDKQKERGKLYCEYCGKGPLVIYDFTVNDILNNKNSRFNSNFNKRNGATADHKDPQSKGGDKYDYKNLAVSCHWCNQKKADMTYDEWIKSPIYDYVSRKNKHKILEKVNPDKKEIKKNFYIELRKEIDDICLELSDFQLKHTYQLQEENNTIVFYITRDRIFSNDAFSFDNLKYTVEHLISYLESIGYELKKAEYMYGLTNEWNPLWIKNFSDNSPDNIFARISKEKLSSNILNSFGLIFENKLKK